MHLNGGQPIQGFSYRPIGDFQCLIYALPFYHFGNHRTGGDSGSTAEGLEFGVNDGAIIYLDVELHNIAAHRVPYMSNAIGIFYLSHIPRVLEVLHHLLTI